MRFHNFIGNLRSIYRLRTDRAAAAGRLLDRVPPRPATSSLASPIFEGQDILGLLSETESSSERIYEWRRADSMYDSIHEGSSRGGGGGIRVITQS